MAARKRLAEAKALAAQNCITGEEEKDNEKENVKTFDAPSFFSVSSPVKKPVLKSEKYIWVISGFVHDMEKSGYLKMDLKLRKIYFLSECKENGFKTRILGILAPIYYLGGDVNIFILYSPLWNISFCLIV